MDLRRDLWTILQAALALWVIPWAPVAAAVVAAWATSWAVPALVVAVFTLGWPGVFYLWLLHSDRQEADRANPG